MLLRDESDFIRAANMSYDLAAIVTTYLKLFRKHTNGWGDVWMPDESFAVVHIPSKIEGMVCVDVLWKHKYSVTTPTYYDVDDDNFSESWGSSNISGEETSFHESNQCKRIHIPIRQLMMTEQTMIDFFVNKEKELKRAKAMAETAEEIAQLEKRLDELKNGNQNS